MRRPPRLIFRLWNRTRRSTQWLVYFLLICVSDAWDSVFWTSPYDKKFEDSPSESDLWDDAEIEKRYEETPGLEESLIPSLGFCPIKRICHDTVIKPAAPDTVNKTPCEVRALNLVRADTDVLTPRVRRTIDTDDEVLIVMEYVEGKQLALCWDSLSFWEQLRIARILRQYIKQLQKIRHSHSHIPGPLSDSPRRCDGYQFGQRRGPFPNYASLSGQFNRYLREAQSRGEVDPDSELFDDSKPLVFTHHDLNMRNILLGVDGRVWLVDWEWSGFFPQWFEHYAMFSAAGQDEAPNSWKRFIPFIAGPYFEQQQWMRQLGFV